MGADGRSGKSIPGHCTRPLYPARTPRPWACAHVNPASARVHPAVCFSRRRCGRRLRWSRARLCYWVRGAPGRNGHPRPVHTLPLLAPCLPHATCLGIRFLLARGRRRCGCAGVLVRVRMYGCWCGCYWLVVVVLVVVQARGSRTTSTRALPSRSSTRSFTTTFQASPRLPETADSYPRGMQCLLEAGTNAPDF